MGNRGLIVPSWLPKGHSWHVCEDCSVNCLGLRSPCPWLSWPQVTPSGMVCSYPAHSTQTALSTQACPLSKQSLFSFQGPQNERHSEEMGLDSWFERSQHCPSEAAEPMVWARQAASQAAAQGCKSCPEVKLCLPPSHVNWHMCLFAAQDAKFLHGLMQDIFLIAQKSNFQAAKWRYLRGEAWLLKLQS